MSVLASASAADKRHGFVTPKSQRTLRLRLHKKPPRAPGERAAPVLLELPPLAGSAPSPLPPVRIFVGSEPEQLRAERVFLWSVLQLRDPARRYEIHLMKDLAGYDRRSWTTGFTNYRYAIPQLAGGAGKAIYNDVDQVYLADPALLFDRPLGAAALLAIDDVETSVMLMDCARLSPLWPLAQVQQLRDHAHYRRAVAERGLWGLMPAAWNARDHEYRAGRSCLLHYTTLYTQPWRPFPEDYRYADGAEAPVWHALEAAADGAGYTPFTAARPSPDFAAAAAHLREPVAAEPTPDDELRRIARRLGAATTARLGVADLLDAATAGVQADVVAVAGLERAPEDDVAWLLDAAFARAGRAVQLAVPTFGVDRSAAGASLRTRLPRKWWSAQLALAARRKPGVEALLAWRDDGRGRWRHEAARL